MSVIILRVNFFHASVHEIRILNKVIKLIPEIVPSDSHIIFPKGSPLAFG